MSRVPTPDEILFAPLSPSALARAERELSGSASEVSAEVAEGRTAVEAMARALGTGETAERSAGLRGRIVASARRSGKYGRYADRLARMFDVSVDEAHAILKRAEDPGEYTEGPLPETKWMYLKPGPKYAGALAAIGRLEPGSRVPDHGHGGDETTLVLDGGFVEDDGVEVWRGDELFKTSQMEHAFSVIGDEPCIAAVIVEGGVLWKARA